jgi:hypothetical protein
VFGVRAWTLHAVVPRDMHYCAFALIAMHDKALVPILETILTTRFDLHQENRIIRPKAF